MIKVFISIVFICLFSITPGFSQSRLSVGDGKQMDFGDVNAGTKLVHDVTVRNLGNDTLRITEVKAQCGCTATMLSNNTIAPHDSTSLNIVFNSAGYPPGKVTKHVYITSNDTGSHGIYTLEFVASVITPLMLDPTFFSFPSAKIDSIYKKSITILNKTKQPVSIDSLSGSSEQISFSLEKTKLLPGEQTTLQAVLHPVKAGSYQGAVTLFTSVPDQPKLEIRYVAWINRK
jgi:hypothetical protein